MPHHLECSKQDRNASHYADYVYRLESPWSVWESYFIHELQYTCTRLIDCIEDHDLSLRPSLTEDICGLWVLMDFNDAINFQDREPTVWDQASCEARKRDALARLLGTSGLNPLRFCVRIDTAAFEGERLYPDLPLIEQYPSSSFHPRLFDTLGKEWRNGAIDSMRVPHVTISDSWVQIYFDGAWYPKTPQVGTLLRRILERENSVDGLLLTVDSVNAPIGNVADLRRRAGVHEETPSPAAGSRTQSWLAALIGRLWTR